MVVDDEWLRVGSANVCNRSMGMDTECDVTFEAGGEARIAAVIADVRNRLVAEHLGVTPEQVQTEHARTGSLNGAIRALRGEERSLKTLDQLPEWPEAVVSVAALADPEKPVALDALIKEFTPNMKSEKSGPSWVTFLVLALIIAGLAAMWRFTPLGELVTADKVMEWAREFARRMEWAREFARRPWAPLVVLLAYTPACFIMFPRPLITLFSVVAFGAWMGFAYAMAGILIAALATYYIGRLLDRSTVRRLAGTKLNQVSEVLRKRGLIACTALRLVPVAPFAVEGLVAGAIRIKLWHFMLGTALGILPGTLATTVFGDQMEAALRDPAEINYWLVAGAALLLVVAILVVRKWFSVQIGKQTAALSNA
nr:SNARE associated Golgi protein [uncultured bacterium]